jgi:hypothetical protein
MGKVVKGIVAVGMIVAGAITGNPLLIAQGLSMGISVLSPTPKAPKASPASADRLFASIDPRTPRKIVFGHTAMATDVRDQEYTDDQTYFHRFLVVASHKVAEIEEIWFDDKQAWTSGGGVQGDFSGYLTVTTVLEGNAGNAINISSRMGSSRLYTGLAYVHLKYKLTGNSKKTDSPFSQSIPSRVTIRGKGAYLYDPRLDSTVAGGSGSHRADDQTTWEWDDDAGRNVALQTLWYLLGWRIQNPTTSAWKLAVGKGIPPARIDLESFITAANACDEAVAIAAGGTEPRYRGDGIFSEGDDPTLVLDQQKLTMNATLDDVDGKIRLTVLVNDLATPAGSLDTSAVIGAFKWAQTPSLTDSYNVVRGTFVDASDTALYQSIDFPEVQLDSPDDIDRVQTLSLQLVQSPSQAQRLAKQRLQRMQYGGAFTAVFQATAWKYLKGDVIEFTFAPLGWTDKLFRVADIEVRVDGTVPMMLREENEDSYAWDASDEAPVVGADPTLYIPSLHPVIQDLNDALAPAIADVAPYEVQAASDGTPLTGQLPMVRSFRCMLAGVDVSEDADFAYETTAGLSFTLNNTPSDAQRGDLQLDTLDVPAGQVRVSAAIGGQTAYKLVAVTRTDMPPSTGGGGGASSASDTTLTSPGSSSTNVVMSDVLAVLVGASGQIDLGAGGSFGSGSEGYVYPSITDPTDTYLAMTLQYSANGTTGWSDVGAEETGNYPAQHYYSSEVPKGERDYLGYTSLNRSKTGLVPAVTAYFRLAGRLNGGTSIANVAGGVTATAV